MSKLKMIFLSLCFAFLCLQTTAYSSDAPREKQGAAVQHLLDDETPPLALKSKHKLVYYLYIQDFVQSFISIPTSNVSGDSTTISSSYLAGRAPIYKKGGKKFGICSASFLCMQNQYGIFSDISNYLTVDNGLIVSWFTPSTLANLELDSIVHGMVTECIVLASTKVGFNPFYGKQFNMVVSADNNKIYFALTPIH